MPTCVLMMPTLGLFMCVLRTAKLSLSRAVGRSPRDRAARRFQSPRRRCAAGNSHGADPRTACSASSFVLQCKGHGASLEDKGRVGEAAALHSHARDCHGNTLPAGVLEQLSAAPGACLPRAVTCTAVAHAAEAGNVSGRLPVTALSDAVLSSIAAVMASATAPPCSSGEDQGCTISGADVGKVRGEGVGRVQRGRFLINDGPVKEHGNLRVIFSGASAS